MPKDRTEYFRQYEYKRRKKRGKRYILSRKNKRRVSSPNFVERYTRNPYVIDPAGDSPSKSGQYTKGQLWFGLIKAWQAFKINNRKGSYFDRLKYAIRIQNLQTELEIRRSSFPSLGLLGDHLFLFDKEKEEELRQEEDMTEKEYEDYRRQKEQRKMHIRRIVHIDTMTDAERESIPSWFAGEDVEQVTLFDRN